MKELNFYSNKLSSFLLLLISSAFVIAGLIFGNELINFEEQPFGSIILIFSFLLFLFAIILSILLLIRKKPLLTITNSQIIIYNVLTSSKIVDINNIKSFFLVNNYSRGIKTNRQIFIEMKKPTEKYLNMWLYKFLGRLSKPIANSQYSIQTDFLDIKQERLLEILNGKIKNAV